jgi:hypothetical protein
MNEIVSTLLIGAVATAVADFWTIVRKILFGVAQPNYGLVGRWIAGLARGRLGGTPIAASTPVSGERAIGWIAHYAIGIAFAALLPAFWGAQWIHNPTFAPAMIVGIATVAAPYFILQPGMGAGVAAARTPRPAAARLHSLVMHAVFGVGLFVGGTVVSCLSIGG